MKLTTVKIATTNYWRKPLRSFGLSTLVAVLSAVLLVGLLFSFGLDLGLSRLSSRLGADAIVIPRGTVIDEQSVLLQGENKHEYMGREVLDFVRTLDGVAAATPQFYFTTLGANCCDQKVNVVSFESSSDFVIKPWIREVFSEKIPKGALVVGSEIRVENGNTIKFFDKVFPVAARLEPLGNKLDQTVFAESETVALLKEAAENTGYHFLRDDLQNVVSSVLVKLEEGASLENISWKLHAKFDDLQIKGRKDLFGNFEATVKLFKSVIWALILVFVVVVVASVYIVFVVSTNERKQEFALLRVIGATTKKLRNIVIAESLIVSGVGSLIGTFFGIVIFFSFRIVLEDFVTTPFLIPSVLTIVVSVILSLLLPLLLSTLSAGHVACKISKLDVYASLREKGG